MDKERIAGYPKTTFTLTMEDARALEESGIVEFRGVSGMETSIETAFDAPMLCQMHSLAGDVYNLDSYGDVLVATQV